MLLSNEDSVYSGLEVFLESNCRSERFCYCTIVLLSKEWAAYCALNGSFEK